MLYYDIKFAYKSRIRDIFSCIKDIPQKLHFNPIKKYAKILQRRRYEYTDMR